MNHSMDCNTTMATTNTTSLLAGEEEEGVAPALGGTANPESLSDDFQSPLERLIAHANAEQQSHEFGTTPGPPRINSWSPNNTPTPLALGTKPPLITLAACVCCLLQTGFVWASFLSKSWLETRLYLSVSLPHIKIDLDQSQLLHTTTLGSLLGNLLSAKQHWAAIALVLTSLVLPCLCAVTGAAWIAEDRKEQETFIESNERHSRRIQSSFLTPRLCIEYSSRIGVAIFFVFCILTIGTSPLPVEYSGSSFIVVNQFTGGLAAYALGTMFGLIVLALLRFGKTNVEAALANTTTDSTSGQGECSWEVRSDQLFTGIKYGNENQAETLETPLLQDNANAESPSSNIRNALVSPTAASTTEGIPPEGLSFCKRVVLFELALAATILWIPALFQPLFTLKYEGIVSDFIKDISLTFRLKDIPIELWKRGSSAGTNRFLLWIIENVFVQMVLGLPLLANLAAIGTWVLEPHARNFCRRLLWILQPFLGTLVFGVALFCSIPAFGTVTQAAVNQFGDGICSKFETVVGDACFGIEAKASVGLWFVLIQAFSLELFVVTTLAWHKAK